MRQARSVTRLFKELKSGDAFLHKDKILMKKNEIIDRDGDTWNAVDTKNGEDYCFADETKVEYVNAVVKVEEIL